MQMRGVALFTRKASNLNLVLNFEFTKTLRFIGFHATELLFPTLPCRHRDFELLIDLSERLTSSQHRLTFLSQLYNLSGYSPLSLLGHEEPPSASRLS